MPGHRILVWYDDPDDPVWHERVLLWPSREVGAGEALNTRWLILTPDDDVYWEEMNCGAGHDVTKVSQLGKRGERPYLDDPIYSFAEPLTESVLLGHVKAGFDIALAEAIAKKQTLQRFEKFLDWEGVMKDLPASFRPPARPPKAGSPADGAGSAGAGLPLGGVPTPREDVPERERAWFLASPAAGKVIGDLIPFKKALWISGKVALVNLDGVGVALVEDPDGRSAEKFLQDKSSVAAECYKLGPATEPEDMRTLGIEKNSRGRRHKPFTRAVAELVEDSFEDWPLRDNIRTFLWFVEKFESDGLAPIAWVEAYLARKKFGDNDRAAHELRSMGKTIECSLVYDQLNGASLCCLEHVSRRFQMIIGAHADNAQQPNYVGADHYLEEGEEAVAPDLKEKVSKKLKDEAKTGANLEKLRELKTKAPRKPGKGDGKG